MCHMIKWLCTSPNSNANANASVVAALCTFIMAQKPNIREPIPPATFYGDGVPSKAHSSGSGQPIRHVTPLSNDGPSGIHSTPVSQKASGTDPFTSLHHMRDFRMRRMASEMEGKFVGPMDVKLFLSTFLPTTATKETFKFTSKDVKKMKKVGNKEKETDMYIPLVRFLLWDSRIAGSR
jgi:hypothetical protein